jgi:hypothetical protein
MQKGLEKMFGLPQSFDVYSAELLMVSCDIGNRLLQ